MRALLAAPLALVLFTACGTQESAPEPEVASEVVEEIDPPPLLEGLGAHRHPITTGSELAQRYFDQGLILSFGFNHDAAIERYREAARLDPECAMCYWGIAHALGPNINAPLGPEAALEAYAAAQRAIDLASTASEAEQRYIAAQSVRYAADPQSAERADLDKAYANAMREVSAALPDDLDAATLFAESLMNLRPWAYWSKDGEATEYTPEIVTTLEGVMAREPNHPGANHFYIHAVEASKTPDRAEAAADRLATVAPGAGHLVHMPSHIYWRVGRYQDALEINREAAAADEAYFATCARQGIYGITYYPHNIHFLWAAAAASGQSDIALTSARRLEAETRPAWEEAPFVEEFTSTPVLTLVRFGRWDEVLGAPEPPASHVYETGLWRYARGLAFTRGGQLPEAGTELAALRAQAALEGANALLVANGLISADSLLELGAQHLAGEIAAAAGDYDTAVAELERAVETQDGLAYIEPPPWYFPVRQALGAVLLDAGRPAEAAAVFHADLEGNPRNGWSLRGLELALREQGNMDDAAIVHEGFMQAWAQADVELETSRF
jgi:tetratricopeptide (TPR) repeat protein